MTASSSVVSLGALCCRATAGWSKHGVDAATAHKSLPFLVLLQAVRCRGSGRGAGVGRVDSADACLTDPLAGRLRGTSRRRLPTRGERSLPVVRAAAAAAAAIAASAAAAAPTPAASATAHLSATSSAAVAATSLAAASAAPSAAAVAAARTVAAAARTTAASARRASEDRGRLPALPLARGALATGRTGYPLRARHLRRPSTRRPNRVQRDGNAQRVFCAAASLCHAVWYAGATTSSGLRHAHSAGLYTWPLVLPVPSQRRHAQSTPKTSP